MYAHAQAPVRIGIAGGGTDLPAWTRERTGFCLSLALKMYTHAVAISRPDGQVVASYARRDVSSAATEIANGLIRESALLHGWEDSFEVHTLSELSSFGSGLGVSSSIAVALAACFTRLASLRAGSDVMPRWRDGGEEVFRQQIARDAWTVEIDKLRRPIGRQDHMAAAHGGLKLYRFEGDSASVERAFSVEDAAWVAQHLVLVKLPEGHDSRAILAGVKNADALKHAADAVDVAVQAIEKRSPRLLGEAFLSGQKSKREIPGAVPFWLVEIVDEIERVRGVYSCKVAGAGGGGHVVVACEPGTKAAIERATNLPVLEVEPDFGGVRSEGWA